LTFRKIENEKIKQEVNALKKERTTFRNSVLMNLDLGFVSFNDNWIYFPDRENSMQYVNIISYKDVENLDADAWENSLIEIKNKIAECDIQHKKIVDKLLQDAIIKKEQAEKDIADAKAQADAEVNSIKAGVAERTKKSVADADTRIAQVNAAAQQAKATYDKEVAVMSAAKASLQADVNALETKLASLREQAKKFAASLVE
jgi:hypothetical protein